MSDNNENKKAYPEGTVQISSREYRDIVEEVVRLTTALDEKERERSKLYWDEYHAKQEIEKLKCRVEKLNKELADIQEFIYISDDRKAAFKSFLFDKMQEKEMQEKEMQEE